MKSTLLIATVFLSACSSLPLVNRPSGNLEQSVFLRKYSAEYADKILSIPSGSSLMMQKVVAKFGHDYSLIEAPFAGIHYRDRKNQCLVFFYFDSVRPTDPEDEERILGNLSDAEILSIYYYDANVGFFDGVFVAPSSWRGLSIRDLLPDLAKRFKLR